MVVIHVHAFITARTVGIAKDRATTSIKYYVVYCEGDNLEHVALAHQSENDTAGHHGDCTIVKLNFRLLCAIPVLTFRRILVTAFDLTWLELSTNIPGANLMPLCQTDSKLSIQNKIKRVDLCRLFPITAKRQTADGLRFLTMRKYLCNIK